MRKILERMANVRFAVKNILVMMLELKSTVMRLKNIED